jgi:hypothetical protein
VGRDNAGFSAAVLLVYRAAAGTETLRQAFRHESRKLCFTPIGPELHDSEVRLGRTPEL